MSETKKVAIIETLKVRRVGGTLVVTLPKRVIERSRLREGDDIEMCCFDDGIIAIQKAGETSRPAPTVSNINGD